MGYHWAACPGGAARGREADGQVGNALPPVVGADVGGGMLRGKERKVSLPSF